ncbi:MAG: hypothetical protein HOE83_17130 [Alphaproteobacteria bacterium]|jgi:hypothetical protein|nr:hypothetical protein [Alphaproteobacteria bacterium]
MAATAAPYGFVPVNRLGGIENGSFRQLKMTNSYGTSIFHGDIVTLAAAGTIEIETTATSSRPIGVFQGCSFTDPTLNYKLFAQMWTASTSATDILAHVADDPRQLFQVQGEGSWTQVMLGLNAEVSTYVAGNTNFGKSVLSLEATTPATTGTFPFRSVDFVDGPDSSVGDAFTDMIVMWNADIHQYDLALGT